MSGYKFPMSQPSLFTPDAHTFYASVNSNNNNKNTLLFSCGAEEVDLEEQE